MAGHLSLVILIILCSETKGQDLAAPKLSVEPEIITRAGSVRFNCQTPVPEAGCFYRFGKSLFKKMPCRHSLNGSALLSLGGRVSAGEVNVFCFYLNHTASPHSERKVIRVQDLGPPTLSVYPAVITEYTTVTLSCQPPRYVSASRCSFYSLTGLKFGRSSCVQTLTGSDLLKKRLPPVEDQVTCYYFENEDPSPQSNKRTVAVKASTFTTTATATTTTTTTTTATTTAIMFHTTAHLLNSETTTSQETTMILNPVESVTEKTPISENLIQRLMVTLKTCGVIVGCVMLVMAFFCIKQRKDKVNSQDPCRSENHFCGGEAEHAADAGSVSANQPCMQDDDEVDPCHPYASITASVVTFEACHQQRPESNCGSAQ